MLQYTPVRFKILHSGINAEIVQVVWKNIVLNDTNHRVLLVRADQSLLCFKYDKRTLSWQLMWNENEVFRAQDESRHCPWLVTDDGFIVLRNGTGIHVFKLDDQLKLKRLASDGRYHDIYGWNHSNQLLLFGFFNADRDRVGILSRNAGGNITFEAVIKEEAIKLSALPIWPMEPQPQIPSYWRLTATKITLAYVDDTNQQAFIVRNQNELNIHKFDKAHAIKTLLTTKVVPFSALAPDDVFFQRTPSKIHDMLHFNSTGMTKFRYNGPRAGFIPTINVPKFSYNQGWTVDHTNSIVMYDLDRDGRDELVFIGPSGLNAVSFASDALTIEHVLDSQDFNVSNRHFKAFTIVDCQNDSSFISVTDDTLTEFRIETASNGTMKTTEVFEDTTYVEDTAEPISLLPPASSFLSILPLHDQLNTTSFLHPRNPLLGILDFSIPIINLKHLPGIPISHSIYYKEYRQADILGSGWHLPVDCIYVDRRGSVFSIDHNYYLVKDGSLSDLKPVLRNDSPDYILFTLEGSEDVIIKFYKLGNRWEISTKFETLLYGSSNNVDWIQWEPGSDVWPGASSKISFEKLKPSVWFLAMRKDFNDNFVKYVYEPEYASLESGQEYVRKLNLLKVSNNHGDFVHFVYSQKYNKKLMMGFHLKSVNLSQDVKFEYTLIKSAPRLVSINQLDVAILRFSYEGLRGELTKIQYPNGLVSQFSYNQFEFPAALAWNKFDFFTNAQVTYGPGYLVVSGQTESGQVRIMSRDIVGSKTIAMSELSFPYLGKERVNSYEVLTADYFFFVLLTHENHKELCLFRKLLQGWSSEASYMKLSKQSTLMVGKAFVLIRDGTKLAVLQLNDKRWDTKPVLNNLNQSTVVQAFSYAYVVYDDVELRIDFQNMDGVWTSKKLPIEADLVRSSLSILNRFDTDALTLEKLQAMFESSLLHVHHNALIIRTLAMRGMHLYSNLHFYVMNEKYELKNQETIEILIENLENTLLALPPLENNYFKIGYKEVNGKFKVVVKGHTGSILDQMDKKKLEVEAEIQKYPHASREEVEDFRRKSYDQLEGDLQEIHRNVSAAVPFAIDPSKFDVFVNSDHVIAVSTRVRFNGERWIRETIPHAELTLASFSLKLDESTVLSRSGKNDTYKLFKSGKLFWDSNTIHGEDILLSYPVFIGVSRSNGKSKLLTLENNKIHNLPKGERLSKISNSLAIVSTTEDAKSVIIRSVKPLLNSRQSVITKQEIIHNRYDQQSTEFDYDTKYVRLYPDGLAFFKSKILPGGDSSLGWFEEEFNLGVMNNSTRTVYNSKGDAVKTIDASEKVENINLDNDAVLRDLTGVHEIVNFQPFRISQEMVSYYGFEPYEVNRIGVNDKWVFDRQSIMQNNSNHFLRLSAGASISGRFKPEQNDFSFVSSCWVRTNQSDVLPDSVTLSVISSNNDVVETIKGKIERNIGEWYYVEALYQPKQKSDAVGFHVRVKNIHGYLLDVDHVRFTPLQFNFEANLLDFNGNVRAVLTNSGTLRQTVRDLFGNVVAQVSEKGAVEFFASMSKNSALRKNTELLSRIEMRPMMGEIDLSVSKGKYKRRLKYQPQILGFRFLYKLSDVGSIILNIQSIVIRLHRSKNHTTFKVGDDKTHTVNSEGECLVLITKSHSAFWIDGHLVFERQFRSHEEPWSIIDVETSDSASLAELIYMYDPAVKIFYLNKLGFPVQEIILTSHNIISCRQIVYDQVDRPVLKTKWTELERDSHALLNYNSNLLTNMNRVPHHRKLEGLVNEHNADCEGYPYTWVYYSDDPLENKSAEGLPGKSFSIVGQHFVKYGSNPNIAFLKVLFPQSEGFNHNFEVNSASSTTVRVTDRHGNKVAELVKVVNHDHRLTTFEYDEKNRLLCVLPPAYHRKSRTFSETSPFQTFKLTVDAEKLRAKWGKRFRYDANGRLVEKNTPDSGNEQYMYTKEGLLRFLIHSNSEQTSHYVIYYSYGFNGNIIEKGLTEIPISKLHEYLENHASLPISANFIVYDSGENELIPGYRNHVKKSSKRSGPVTVSEALLYNFKKQLTSQIFVSSNNSLSIDYKYQNEKLTEIHYPFMAADDQLLKISYKYTANGKIKTVRVGNRTVAALTYTPFDAFEEIHFEPNGRYNYKRLFSYNAPGFITGITDKFLTETVDYTANSYSGQTFGDGTVSATTFNATWHHFSNLELVKLKPAHLVSPETTLEYADICLKSLQKLGYLDKYYRPQKTFYPSSELQLPIICSTGSRANSIAAKLIKGFPQFYGHRHDYENHKQLLKAKYFQSIDESKFAPLTETTFSTYIKELTSAGSKAIWNALKTAGFIITDCSNSMVCHGLPGKSIFDTKISNHTYGVSLETLFAEVIRSRKDLRELTFSTTCKTWHSHDPVNQTQICNALWAELLKNNFVGSRSIKSVNVLNEEFIRTLKPHSRFLTNVVHILIDGFSKALSNCDADVQSYEIDANGNHLHFYTGFNRYRMEYTTDTNKIDKVYHLDLKTEAMQEREYRMRYDFDGSVIEAAHKGIKSIVYDRLLKRARAIEMKDGRKLTFEYNVRGERIFKQVKYKNGTTLKNKYYIRDIKGRCLTDHEVIYSLDGRINYIRDTAYIFAENTMIGFFRNNQFYSVFSDHEGSIRLVIRNGEVVAAYDYLPYGHLSRKYLSDPDADIAYLYTGQEWDEETKLYNFHARLYDPEIGRFFQIDPKEQYPSPYVYAGNSPISLVDPDGQFAFLIPIALAVVGAYLGASAANKSFNPTKWSLKPTLYGGILGAVVGGLAPSGITTSFSFLTVTLGVPGFVAGGIMVTSSLTFAYLSTAAVNKKWDPSEWDWASPQTWNALFAGSISGATFFSGVDKVHKTYLTFSNAQKIVFIGFVTSSTAGVALYTGADANNDNYKFWEWNWSNPETVWAVTSGANFGMSVSPELSEHVHKVTDFIKSIESGNIHAIFSKQKFAESMQQLTTLTHTKLKLLAKQARSYGALAAIAAASPKGTAMLDDIEQVLFETTKYVTALKARKHDPQPEKLSNISRYRKQRNIDCCQLQTVNHWSILDNMNVLKSGVSSVFTANKFFLQILNGIKHFFKTGSTVAHTFSKIGFPGQKQNEEHRYTLNNCFRLKTNETYYIKCFGHNARYEIYPNLDTQSFFIEDSFTHCMPIDYWDKPSVVCKGANSSLFFIPHASGNILEAVNAFLLLLLIAPAALTRIKTYFYSLGGKSNKMQKNSNSREHTDALKRKLSMFWEYFAIIESNRENHFMKNIYSDLIEDIDEYAKNKNEVDFDQLLTRTEALMEEIRETMILSSLHNDKHVFEFPMHRQFQQFHTTEISGSSTAIFNINYSPQNLFCID
ncbi:uncharacterized protein LOC129731205 [Wyeomyia smithii]|uniref:uncharacterized protein LOC129731205 n=1 Tax=Wyeomyia smithii TaxID=174621 RepID=UPI002467F84F|nr:uncharacterized protein LOC129731205 [Wyeomyia smithii]